MLGVPLRVQVPGVEEREEGDPREVAVDNARRKARAALGATVLGVDTLVVVDGQVHGKPAGAEEAERVLRRLSGRTHEVWSGLALRMGGEERVAAARTLVRFRPLDDAWIKWYLATGEWRGRAGGYAIQGRGAALVEGIEGDYWNVVGLPVPELVRLAPGLVLGGQPRSGSPGARLTGEGNG
jgi:septum formation protein